MKKWVAMLRTDHDDRDFTETALAETGHDVTIKFMDDLDELERISLQSGQPALILLNDNDAAHKGYERLAALKANQAYRHIPVILLGEKSTADYIRRCYSAGASSVIIKPSTVAETNQKIGTFFNYWLRVAEL